MIYIYIYNISIEHIYIYIYSAHDRCIYVPIFLTSVSLRKDNFGTFSRTSRKIQTPLDLKKVLTCPMKLINEPLGVHLQVAA